MERYWFKNKRLGIGWAPATWEGWLCIALFMCWTAGVVLRFNYLGLPDSAVFEQLLAPVWFGVFVLIVISVKTGEPLEWKFWKKKDE